VTDAYEYQLLDCVLTVTTNVTSAAEVALAEAATYTFTNACSVGDDFNADSSACWTVWAVEEEGELPPWPTWAALLDTSTGLLAFETSESTLIYSSNGKEADSGAFIYKAAVPNADGFSIIVKYTDLLTRGSGEDLDSLGFMLMQEDPATLEDPGKDGTYISMGLSTDNGEGNIPLCANTSSGSDPEYIGEVDCSSIDTLYMKLLFDGSTLTGSWSSDGDTYETISGDEGSWPTDFSGYNYLVILMETAEENPDTLFNIDHISTSGLTSTTQY